MGEASHRDHETPPFLELLDEGGGNELGLYIDAPATGFSYPLDDDIGDGVEPDIGIDIDRDTSNVLRVLLRFLQRHPGLHDNPIIFVGESSAGSVRH